MKLKLSKIFEDLEYAHSNTVGPEDDGYEIGLAEDNSLNFRLNKQYPISEKEKNLIRNISPDDLIISQGHFDGKTANMIFKLPWNSKFNDGGIIIDIHIIQGILYQPHVSLSDSIQSLGLGYKIYEALINDLGHTYSGSGRRLNNVEIPKIFSKLKDNPNIETFSGKNFNLFTIKNNPDKEKILNVLQLHGE